MTLDQLVSDVAGRLLTADAFDTHLSDTLELLADHYGCAYTACCIEQGRRRREFAWDTRDHSHRVLGAWPWARQLGPGCVEAQVIPANLDEVLTARDLSHGVIASVGLEHGGSLHLLVAGTEPPANAQSVGAVASVLGVGASRQSFMDEALFDPLTELYNRRYMDLTLPGELERAKRYRSALTLLIIDVDHFKEINDSYGHVTGDRVLAAVSRVLERSIRRSDVPVRYGGDEFVLILPATSVEGVKSIASRVRDRLSRVQVGPIDGLTVSGGVAAARSDLTPEKLLHEADALLYQAKENGRNAIQFPHEFTEFPAPQSHYAGPR